MIINKEIDYYARKKSNDRRIVPVWASQLVVDPWFESVTSIAAPPLHTSKTTAAVP